MDEALGVSMHPLIAWLKTRPVVVLSPHFDDACLSVGSILSALDGATLVNVFTRSVWLKTRGVENPTEDYVRTIRDAEDMAFAERVRLDRHDLHCYEPGVVGRNPRDPSHIDEDVVQARTLVLAKLDALAGPDRRPFLLAPLGVGRHVNHHALVEIVLGHHDRLSRSYDLLFYEDQPYAAEMIQRVLALRRFRKRLEGSRLRRHVFTPSWAAKKALIDLYPSQFPPPVSPRRFRPAALWPLAPHEAVWSIS
jgi:hypothetical protein